MEEAEIQRRLEGVELGGVILNRIALETDAFDNVLYRGVLTKFAQSLGKEEWTGEELLSHIESCEFFRTLTASMTPMERIHHAQIIRGFILEELALEVRLGRFADTAVDYDMDIEIRTKVSKLMDAHVLKEIDEKAEAAPPPVALESLNLPVSRLGPRIRQMMNGRIQSREEELRKMEAQTGLPLFLVEGQRALVEHAKAEKMVAVRILSDMSHEMRGKTDADFFMKEFVARIREAFPERADSVLRTITGHTAELATEIVTRDEPGFGKAPEADRRIYLRDARHRFNKALWEAAGLREEES